MKTAGIISEYNPFHNGHLYHVEKTRELAGADFVVAVMSGNFVQRGEPAIINKWERAKTAVSCGVDLVLELPFAFACNNAEYFARGAVEILDSLGCVDFLSFGSESGNLDEMQEAAVFLSQESEAFKERLHSFLDRGDSYPKARSAAAAEFLSPKASQALENPNSILGVEYLKHLLFLDSSIVPMTIKRKGTGYHDKETQDSFASASALRSMWMKSVEIEDLSAFVPDKSLEVIKKINRRVNIGINDLHQLIFSSVLKTSAGELSKILASGEGLENRILSSIRRAGTVEELIDLVVSKRYTRTRVSRLLMQILVGLSKEDFFWILDNDCLYARVLAFNDKGRHLLRHIKKSDCSRIPILTNINKEVSRDSQVSHLLKYDILSSDFYNLAAGENLYQASDYVKQPFRMDL